MPGLEGPLPGDAQELMQLKEALEGYLKTGQRFGPVPDDLKALLDNHHRDQGRPVEQVEGEDVTPTPGFVVKTSEPSSGGKVFLNICTSRVIPEPAAWTSGSLPDHVVEALEQAGSAEELQDQNLAPLRLPCSCSEPRPDTDKKGETCLVIDCIFNPLVLEAATRMRHFKSFLVALSIDHAQTKLKLDLDKRFKLPKMTYKGDTVLTQRVRKERKPLVTDMGDMFEEPSFPLVASKPKGNKQQQQAGAQGKHPSSSLTTPAPAAAKGGSAQAAAAAGASSRGASSSEQQLSYTLATQGRPAEVVRVEVQLPNYSSSSSSSSSPHGLQVALQGMQLQVHATGCQPLSVPLPFYVEPAAATARLAAATGVLTVLLPYASLEAYLAAVQAAGPAAYGSLPLDHSAYMELDE